MPEHFVLDNLAQFLVDESIAVKPADADGMRPSVWIDPPDGAPAPTSVTIGGRTVDLRPATITLVQIGTAGLGFEDNARDRPVIQLTVRGTSNAGAQLVIRQIDAKLNPIGDYRGRQMFKLAAIDPVELCIPFRKAQRVRSADQDFAWDLAFEFWVRRKVLSGLSIP